MSFATITPWMQQKTGVPRVPQINFNHSLNKLLPWWGYGTRKYGGFFSNFSSSLRSLSMKTSDVGVSQGGFSVSNETSVAVLSFMWAFCVFWVDW